MNKYLAMTVSRFDDAAAAHQTVMAMGCIERYDIPPVKRFIAESLGGIDTLFTPQTTYGELYAAAPYLGQEGRALRPEMGALTDMVKVELARQILATPLAALKSRMISQPETFWRDDRLAESVNVSPTTAMYLQNQANLAVIRARFPQANISAARIDAVLRTSNGAYKPLPEHMKHAPLKHQVRAIQRMGFV